MAKHDWNSLQNYLEIHDKTIRFYHRWMEIPRVYNYTIITESYHTLTCSKAFLTTYSGTRVRVDIRKDIEVDLSNAKRPRARTFRYSYSANIPGGRNLIRYCSPHDDWEEEGNAPHHAHHHCHEFSDDSMEEIALLRPDDWPHVGEFLIGFYKASKKARER